MSSYDPKAKRPRLVPVDDAEDAPVDALLGPNPSSSAGPEARAEPAASAPQHLAVVPDRPDVPELPSAAAAAGGPAAADRTDGAPASSPSGGRRVLAAATVAAAVLACFVAWRGLVRRRAER